MLSLLLTIVSLLFIIKLADIFVEQAIALSKKLKISGFVVGFFLVSIGTTLPEISTSIYSTVIGHPEVAISSVIGCNITNILLILGSLALIKKFKLKKIDANFNIPFLLVITVSTVLVIVLNDFIISSLLGIIFLLIFLASSFLINGKNNGIVRSQNVKNLNILLLVLPILLIPIFSKICIDNLVIFAEFVNIPEVFMSYFLLAIGASLPEFATLYSSLKKGREDLGIGNIIGSNIIHFLFILGTASLITPLNLFNFQLELVFVLLATILLFLFGIFGKKYYISKKEGFLLLSCYLLFVFVQLYIHL